MRLVGRGGDGVVTAGELLGEAALRRGRHAQSIPSFGPERRGALSSSTLRISDEPILLKCAATRPGVLLVLDPTIWHHAPVTLGLLPASVLVFNSPLAPDEIRSELLSGRYGHGASLEAPRVLAVDATGIALETLGRPIPNTAMMGAFTGALDVLDLEAVEEVLRERFGARGDANVEAARRARVALVAAGG
jgi:2-oxoacid:acceptor oxidoreductase gamma subunit (pyruvate/2-ketoisovalerate family)